MLTRTIIYFLLSFLILTVNILSQTKINKKSFVGKSYWTKFVLGTVSYCKIEITPNDISPGENFCGFDSFIKPDTEIKLKELFDDKDWARLIFEIDARDFEVFLKNDSKKNFRQSFNLAFANKKLDGNKRFLNCNVKSKLDVIKNFGFPAIISRDEKMGKWTFDINWIGGSICGFDETFIKIENDRVVGISGTI